MSFKKQFAKEREAHIEAARHVVRMAAIEMVNYTITASPVGNTDLWKTDYPPKQYVGGRFRSNFFLTLGEASSAVTDQIRQKGALIQQYTATILSSYSQQYTLANNLPYAQRLDNGWSTQAPTGVTAPARLHVESKIQGLIKIANRKYGIK